MEDPDAPAIRAVLAGAPSRFDEVVKRHHRALLRLVSGLVMDRHLAEDVAQEVWWNVYRRLESFEFRASFKTWMFKIAVREAMSAKNRLRRLVRETFSPGDLATTDLGAGDAEVADDVRRALKALPPRERAAFLLHVEGFRYEDIAASLSCPPGTVATWIHRARGRLMDQLKQLDELGRSERATVRPSGPGPDHSGPDPPGRKRSGTRSDDAKESGPGGPGGPDEPRVSQASRIPS